MKARALLDTIVALTLLAGPVSANVIVNTYPPYSSQNQFTDGFLFTAQTFTPPAGNTVLVSWQFELAARYAEPGNAQFSIFEWPDAGPVGPSLFTASVPWPTSITDPIVSGINLSLEPGRQYAAVIDLLGYEYNSVLFGTDVYPSGNGFWNNGLGWIGYPQFDLTFRAEFAPVPEPLTGTLSALAFAVFGVWYWRNGKQRKKYVP